jgi:branched-chain amino acid transport system ATP-binding protein
VSDIILESLNIRKGFGGVVALDNLTFLIERNSITAIIGPNGAGKTTLLNVVSGVYPPDRGSIFLNRNRISGLKPFEITSCGMARTFQNAQIFSNMTVLENVMVGCHTRTRSGIASAALRLPGMRREEPVTYQKAQHYLEMVGLSDIAQRPAASIPIGNQRLLEIARALATEPQILLLDEPAAGLNTQETRQLGDLIRSIKELNITVVIVEHDMELVMDISDEIIVLNYGKRIAEGKPVEIQSNQEVIDVYLGKEE